MMHLLKRHHMPMRASFDFVLSLTYAVPAERLSKFTTPGLRIDEWQGFGFVAAAFVQTRSLRPAILPRFAGASYFFAGYRLFCRYRARDGRELRGLRILRSDTDKRLMVVAGNLLTHYNYHLAKIDIERTTNHLLLGVSSDDGKADVEVTAELSSPPDFLPASSPFPTVHDARRFIGPMSFTFDYESQTKSIIRVRGMRKQWRPRFVKVSKAKVDFIDREISPDAPPRLANCFYLEQVDYSWSRGMQERLANPS